MIEYTTEAKRRILRCIIVTILVFFVVWGQIDAILTHLIEMTELKIITASVFEAITAKLSLCTSIAAAISLPYIVIEVYRFISPGLYKHERTIIKTCVGSFYIVFVAGGIIAVECMISPILNMTNQCYILGIDHSITLDSYTRFVISVFVLAGVICCIPNVSGILTWVGVLSSSAMKRYTKHFIVGSLVCSAIVTPGADILSLVILEVPILTLFEVSILISMAIESIKTKRYIKRISGMSYDRHN